MSFKIPAPKADVLTIRSLSLFLQVMYALCQLPCGGFRVKSLSQGLKDLHRWKSLKSIATVKSNSYHLHVLIVRISRDASRVSRHHRTRVHVSDASVKRVPLCSAPDKKYLASALLLMLSIWLLGYATFASASYSMSSFPYLRHVLGKQLPESLSKSLLRGTCSRRSCHWALKTCAHATLSSICTRKPSKEATSLRNLQPNDFYISLLQPPKKPVKWKSAKPPYSCLAGSKVFLSLP